VRIQIPRKFWKVVLANEDGRLAAYAFILQQDLKGLPEEFSVLPTWKPYLVSIPALQAQLTGFTFPAEIRAADRFSENGRELAIAAGAEIHPNLVLEAKDSRGEQPSQ
jgi:DNA/RNA endonuclease G (NUC1)